ncbi:MAG: major capsid protein [Pseudomonas sp.]|nr:major capsid protein [Pseudomonas sp.]
MDIFDTRTMLAAVEQMHTPSTFLLKTFFSAEETFATKTVDVDIVKGGRKLAPFVSPRHQGKVIERDGFTSSNITPAYIKPKMETNAEQLLNRSPGLNPYATQTPGERAAIQLGKDLSELNDQITRREEWMAASALSTGKVIVKGDGVDMEVNFQMPVEHNITSLADKWGTAAADPIGNLRTWARQIMKKSGRRPTHVILSGAAQDAFMKSEQVHKLLNTRRIDMGMINPQNMPEGVVYLGYLNDPGIDLYAYMEWALNPETDELEPMIAEGQILMGSNQAQNKRLYGAIQDVQAIETGMVEAARFPKTWEEQDPSARWLMLQSAPLPALLEPDAFLTAKVIA